MERREEGKVRGSKVQEGKEEKDVREERTERGRRGARKATGNRCLNKMAAFLTYSCREVVQG